MLAILEDENSNIEQNFGESEGNVAYEKYQQVNQGSGGGCHSKQPTGETAHFVIQP